MSIYLKKFETQSAYEAAQSSLILPNVSLTVDNNTVHYNPSSPTPPTPPFFCKITAFGDIIDIEGSGELTLDIIYNYVDETYSIESAEIGTLCTSIGDGVFYGSILTSIDIPNSVTSIGSDDNEGAGAFDNCGLTSIDIPDSVTSIGSSAFYNCISLSSCTIGSGVTSIGNDAFYHCSGLTSIDIPNGVTSIGWGAFYGCSGLTSCTIGSGVTSIGNNAINGCSSLTSVTVNATTPPTLDGDNFDLTNNCPIYVPASSVNAYKSASGWSTYASRIQAIP